MKRFLLITMALLAIAFPNYSPAASITDLEGITGKIGQEDIYYGTGAATDTFTVPTYDGGTTTLTKVPNPNSGSYSKIKGAWYVSDSSAITDHAAASGANYTAGNIKKIIDLIGSDNAYLVLTGNHTYPILANLSFPDNITVIMMPGTIMSHGAYTLTFGGPVALTNDSLSGTGLVSFGVKSVSAIDPEFFVGQDTVKVQRAVYASLATSSSIPMKVRRQYTLTSPVYIDRLVDTTTDEYRIIGEGADAGFITSAAITMFSSTLTQGDATGFPVSEFVTFEGIRFASTDNTIDNFVLSKHFLRMKFLNCYFDKIRLGYTPMYWQSFYLTHANIRRMNGIFLQAVNLGTGGLLPGRITDLHIDNSIWERGQGAAVSKLIKTDVEMTGTSITNSLFENQIGPVFEGIPYGVNISGNYFEDFTDSVFKLHTGLGISFIGNLFQTSADPSYYNIDCGDSYSVSGLGNYSNGNLYKAAGMYSPKTSPGNPLVTGLTTLGDISRHRAVADVDIGMYAWSSLVPIAAELVYTVGGVATGAYTDSTAVVAADESYQVTSTEPYTADLAYAGPSAIISRHGTGVVVESIAAGTNFTITCSAATGYKIRFTNGAGTMGYIRARISRLY